MMGFDAIRERMKASAAAAVEAASKIPDFDDMAAKDDYIHSEGLNVKKTKQTTASSLTPALPGTIVKKPALSAEVKTGLFSVVDSIVKEKSEVLPAPVAAAAITTTTTAADNQKNQTNAVVFGDSDDEDDDPILRLVRITKPKKMKDEQAVVPVATEPTSAPAAPKNDIPELPHEEEKKKNPHRFMEELDKRVAMVEEGVDMLVVGPTQQHPPSQDYLKKSNQDLPPWPGWVQKLATSPVGQMLSTMDAPTSMQQQQQQQHPTAHNHQQENRPVLGPLSRLRQTFHNERKDEENTYQVVVSSSAMLGDEEQAELERMRQAVKADVVTKLRDMIRKNPHYAFIGFTLLLALFAYFYSRHRGNEDDVT